MSPIPPGEDPTPPRRRATDHDSEYTESPPRLQGSGVPSGQGRVARSSVFGGSAIPTVAGAEGGGVTSDINVTPMIDVMLVLLIIFMVITPLLHAYEALLPQARHMVPEPDDDVITLGIDAAGTYYVNADAVARENLTAFLRQIYVQRPGDHLMYLRADRDLDYSIVLDGIEAARAAGVRTIGAITEPLAEEGQRTTQAPADGPSSSGGR